MKTTLILVSAIVAVAICGCNPDHSGDTGVTVQAPKAANTNTPPIPGNAAPVNEQNALKNLTAQPKGP